MAEDDLDMYTIIGDFVEQYAGREAREKVMEGVVELAGVSDEAKSLWVKGAMERLDELLDEETAVKVMEESDLGLVPLQPEVYKYAFPSKTMMLLAAGLPVLVMVEVVSALGQLVRERRIGWTAPPGDAEKMAAAIMEAYEQRANGAALRQRALDAADLEFGRERLLDRWSELIERLGSR